MDKSIPDLRTALASLPAFPPKTGLIAMQGTDEVVAYRRKALQLWLQALYDLPACEHRAQPQRFVHSLFTGLAPLTVSRWFDVLCERRLPLQTSTVSPERGQDDRTGASISHALASFLRGRGSLNKQPA